MGTGVICIPASKCDFLAFPPYLWDKKIRCFWVCHRPYLLAPVIVTAAKQKVTREHVRGSDSPSFECASLPHLRPSLRARCQHRHHESRRRRWDGGNRLPSRVAMNDRRPIGANQGSIFNSDASPRLSLSLA